MSELKVTALGVGNRYSIDLCAHSLLIEKDQTRLLINCGPLVPKILHQLGETASVTHILVLDGEASSIGGLELLGLRLRDLHKHKPHLIYNKYQQQFLVGKLSGGYFSVPSCYSSYGLENSVELNKILRISILVLPPTKSSAVVIEDLATGKKIYVSPLQPFVLDQPNLSAILAADLAFVSVCVDGELLNSTSLDKLLDTTKESAKVWITGYRDRDRITLPSSNLNVLSEGDTLTA